MVIGFCFRILILQALKQVSVTSQWRSIFTIFTSYKLHSSTPSAQQCKKNPDNLSLQSSSEQALTTKKSRVSSISPHLKCVNWHRPLTPLSASSSQKCKHPQLFPDSSLEGSDLAGPFQLFGDVVSTIVCTIVLCTTTSLLYCWKWSSMDFTKLLPSFNTSKKPALSL